VQTFLRLSLESGKTFELILRSPENPVKENTWYFMKFKVDTNEKILEVNFDGEEIDTSGELGLSEIDNFVLRIDELRIGQDLDGDLIEFTIGVSGKVKIIKTLHSYNLTIIFLLAVFMASYAMLKIQETKNSV